MIMGKRLTIVMDDDVHKKLRAKQAKMISTSPKNVSFSKVVNDTLKRNLK